MTVLIPNSPNIHQMSMDLKPRAHTLLLMILILIMHKQKSTMQKSSLTLKKKATVEKIIHATTSKDTFGISAPMIPGKKQPIHD
jgi:hypothetical protein